MKKKYKNKFYRNKDVEFIQKQIDYLGKNAKYNSVEFMNLRILSTIIITLLILLFTRINYIFIPFISLAYYYLFYYIFIVKPIKNRIRKLDIEALTFFEVLTLTLESGRNLNSALEITCFNVDSELSDEFKKCLFEMKFGKTLVQSIDSMKRRIPSETINNILLNISQTSIFGNNIVDTMNNQVNFLRDKQVLEIRSQINKIPNKVSIISVVFIVPLILLIILGPFIVDFLG